jgi:hypothetical protein
MRDTKRGTIEDRSMDYLLVQEDPSADPVLVDALRADALRADRETWAKELRRLGFALIDAAYRLDGSEKRAK